MAEVEGESIGASHQGAADGDDEKSSDDSAEHFLDFCKADDGTRTRTDRAEVCHATPITSHPRGGATRSDGVNFKKNGGRCKRKIRSKNVDLFLYDERFGTFIFFCSAFFVLSSCWVGFSLRVFGKGFLNIIL